MSLRRLLAALVVAVVALLAPAVAAAEEDPFLTDDAPPRVVEVPGSSTDVVLLDAAGVEIPLTGRGAELDGGRVKVYPPRLPAGSYTVVTNDGRTTFTVGSPDEVTRAVAPGASEASPLRWLLVVIPLLSALVLARRRRWPAAGVALIATGAVAAFVALSSPSPSPGVIVQGDPCAGVAPAEVRACATDYVLAVLGTSGPLPASQELTRLSSTPGSTWAPVCHEVAHELGTRTWLATRSVSETITAGSTDCSLGYVHGLLEVLGTYLDDASFPTAAKEACDGLDELYRSGRLAGTNTNGPQSLLGCHHGAGHAAMWRFNEDLTKALPVCANFSQPAQQEECRVGAVMEWVYADQRARVSGRAADQPQPRVNQPVELCMPPVGVLSPGCVEGAVTAVQADDIEPTRQWCVEHTDVLGACVQSLARRMVQIDLSQKIPVLDDVATFCSSLGSALTPADCAERFGYMLLFLSRDLGRTEAFCAALPGTQRTGCARGVTTVIEYAEKVGDSSFNLSGGSTTP